MDPDIAAWTCQLNAGVGSWSLGLGGLSFEDSGFSAFGIGGLGVEDFGNLGLGVSKSS